MQSSEKEEHSQFNRGGASAEIRQTIAAPAITFRSLILILRFLTNPLSLLIVAVFHYTSVNNHANSLLNDRDGYTIPFMRVADKPVLIDHI